MTDDERSRQSARRLAGLLTRSAMALEHSAALVDEYAQLSRTVTRTRADMRASAEGARQAARRSRELVRLL